MSGMMVIRKIGRMFLRLQENVFLPARFRAAASIAISSWICLLRIAASSSPHHNPQNVDESRYFYDSSSDYSDFDPPYDSGYESPRSGMGFLHDGDDIDEEDPSLTYLIPYY